MDNKFINTKYMKFPKNFDFKFTSILKIAGLALVAIIVIALAFRLIGSSFGSFFSNKSFNGMMGQSMPAYDMDYADEEMAYGEAMGAPSLSVRNVMTSEIAPTPTPDDVITGDDSEEFEVTEYRASVETRDLKEDCDKIAMLKSRKEVIFENASEGDRSCNYRFKVKAGSVEEVLGIIEN